MAGTWAFWMEMRVQQIFMKLILREAFVGLLRQQFGAKSLHEGQSRTCHAERSEASEADAMPSGTIMDMSC
jgi:hypothetical protein